MPSDAIPPGGAIAFPSAAASMESLPLCPKERAAAAALELPSCIMVAATSGTVPGPDPTVVPEPVPQFVPQEDRAAKAGARALNKMVSQHSQV